MYLERRLEAATQEAEHAANNQVPDQTNGKPSRYSMHAAAGKDLVSTCSFDEWPDCLMLIWCMRRVTRSGEYLPVAPLECCSLCMGDTIHDATNCEDLGFCNDNGEDV